MRHYYNTITYSNRFSTNQPKNKTDILIFLHTLLYERGGNSSNILIYRENNSQKNI